MSRWLTAIALVALTASSAAAQDVKTVLANASKAMGVENLNSIHYYGPAADFTVGQNNNANYAWPRRNLNDYMRVIDFTQPALRASAVTWAIPPPMTPPPSTPTVLISSNFTSVPPVLRRAILQPRAR